MIYLLLFNREPNPSSKKFFLCPYLASLQNDYFAILRDGKILRVNSNDLKVNDYFGLFMEQG